MIYNVLGGRLNKTEELQEMILEIEDDSGKVVWRCVACGKNFPSKGNIRRHVEQIHFEAPAYECELCGKVLKNKNVYQNHLNLTHGIKKRK